MTDSKKSKWRISDELWREIEPIIPKVPNSHRFGGGRRRMSDRQAMDGIFFVLKTGCQWKALDSTGICSASPAHRRFQEWRKGGIFRAFWIRGLQRYDEIKGIDWRWISMDGSFAKAPLAGSKKLAKTLRTEQNRASSEAF